MRLHSSLFSSISRLHSKWMIPFKSWWIKLRVSRIHNPNSTWLVPWASNNRCRWCTCNKWTTYSSRWHIWAWIRNIKTLLYSSKCNSKWLRWWLWCSPWCNPSSKLWISQFNITLTKCQFSNSHNFKRSQSILCRQSKTVWDNSSIMR